MIPFLYFAIVYGVGGVGASVTYHRILTHRTARLHPWLRRVLIVLALPLGTPIQWVGTHRQHHRHTDRPGDPHSPLLYGFWYAHCGWYIQSHRPVLCALYALGGIFRMFFDAYWRPRSNQEYLPLAVDVAQDPFCAWLSRPRVYQGIVTLYALILVAWAMVWMGGFGIFVCWLSLVVVYNLGDAINSVAHWKDASGATFHQARNLPLLGYVTFGEGRHANHHDHADRACFSDHPAGVDLGYAVMRLFAFFKLLHFTKK